MLVLGVRLMSRHAEALAAGLPRRDRAYITTDESFRFHNIELDKMPGKLNFTTKSDKLHCLLSFFSSISVLYYQL